MKPSATPSANNKKTKILFVTAAALLLLAAAFSLLCGSVKISVKDITDALKYGACGAGERIFLYSRLPRTLGCIFAGSALAAAGAVIQNVLANRLASPGIIGVNSGAGLAVSLCAAFGIYGGWRLSFFAFVGAFAAVLTISFAANRMVASRGTVILFGVALNSILSAISDAVIQFNPDIASMSADFRIGDFSAVTYHKLVPCITVVSLSLIFLFFMSSRLDVMTLGDENARALGLDPSLSRAVFLVLAALLAGCAVSVAGLLSFVGLIIPHIVRKFGVLSSKQLLPLCSLFGGAFVTLCDTAARTFFSPYEIPVGIVMAFIGVPLFVFILIKGGKKHVND